jgi:hypothetical protein
MSSHNKSDWNNDKNLKRTVELTRILRIVNKNNFDYTKNMLNS